MQEDGKSLTDYMKSIENRYIQSHPLDHMYTAGDLHVQQKELSDSYMRLIFGGEPAKNDHFALLYTNISRDAAKNPILGSGDLKNPKWDLSGPAPTRDEMLDVFKNSGIRKESPTERALKSRVTHNMYQTTFYGKRTNRFHGIVGQAAEELYPPEKVTNFPTSNLSSRTGALLPDGSRVPLYIENQMEADPRVIPFTDEERRKVRWYEFKESDLIKGYDEVDRVVSSSSFDQNDPLVQLMRRSGPKY